MAAPCGGLVERCPGHGRDVGAGTSPFDVVMPDARMETGLMLEEIEVAPGHLLGVVGRALGGSADGTEKRLPAEPRNTEESRK